MFAELQQKTVMPKPGQIRREWHLVDLKGLVLGRASSKIAKLLVGKTKPIYTPAVDCGDFVVAVNVDKMILTGDKLEQKHYFHHTAHPGGGRVMPYKRMMAARPEQALYLSVRRMLPKNRLASRQILRLKIRKGPGHPFLAQNPQKLELTEKL